MTYVTGFWLSKIGLGSKIVRLHQNVVGGGVVLAVATKACCGIVASNALAASCLARGAAD